MVNLLFTSRIVEGLTLWLLGTLLSLPLCLLFRHTAMSSERLSVVSSLEEIYPVSSSEAKRYGAMTAEFEKRYGSAPAFIVRSPGRVNLIGEHIDYCGYSVLPMALEVRTFTMTCW